MPFAQRKRKSKKLVDADEGEEKVSRRTSVDNVLGAKVKRGDEQVFNGDEFDGMGRESFDVVLGARTPVKAKIPPLGGADSSDEEVENFDDKNGKEVVGSSKSGKKGSKKPLPQASPRAKAASSITTFKREEAKDDDDEFDYAFEGKPREGKTHKREFKAKRAPASVFMNRDEPAVAIMEEEEEDEEEEQNEEQRNQRQKSIEMTAEQWAAIITIQNEDEVKEMENITFAETLIYEEALEGIMPNLDPKYEVPDYEPSCCLSYQSWFTNFFSQPEFVKKQKACILYVSEKEFEDDNTLHESILASIYCAIFGEDAINVKRFGKHWEEIGFQGSNPATDLRDTGMWGLVQILFFVENCFNVTQMIFDYSQDPEYGFPFCAIALNLCDMGLDLLKESCFDEPAIDVGSLQIAFNMWYCGAMGTFFQTWKESKATMEDSGTVMDILRKQLLGKSTIRRVMVEGSVLSESYLPKDEGEEDGDEFTGEFSSI